MKEKISLQELSVLLAEKAAITKKEAETFLREYFEAMNEELIKSGLLKIKDLGAFKLSLMEDRESINVTTGERVLIPAHYKVAFTPDRKLAEAVNEPFAFFETTEINDESVLEDLKLFPEYNIPEESEPSFEEEDVSVNEPIPDEEDVSVNEPIFDEEEPVSVNEPILDEEEPLSVNEPIPDEEDVVPENESTPEEESSQNEDTDKDEESDTEEDSLLSNCLKCKEFSAHRVYRKKYFKAKNTIRQLRLIIFILSVFFAGLLGYFVYFMMCKQNILKIF